jgi:cystinosin
MWFAIAVQLVMAIFGEVTWLWYIYFFSYIKLVVTLIKYIPQVRIKNAMTLHMR